MGDEKVMDEVAVLGPEGTFSEEAAALYFGGSGAKRIRFLDSIEEIFAAVREGQVAQGVVPVENSTEGSVARTLDAFLEENSTAAETKSRITGEITLRVRHHLMSQVKDLGEVEEVLGHPQALAQCRLWLRENLNGAKITPVSSNAEGARMVARSFLAAPGTSRQAAIGSERAAGIYGLSLLSREIQDEVENTTRFWVLGGMPKKNAVCNKTSLLLMVSNRPGVLFQALEPLARHQVDLSRIESRPSRKGRWDYVFFIDIQGAPERPEVALALNELGQRVQRLKILGAYPQARD